VRIVLGRLDQDQGEDDNESCVGERGGNRDSARAEPARATAGADGHRDIVPPGA
jgi:hypothetical protein